MFGKSKEDMNQANQNTPAKLPPRSNSNSTPSIIGSDVTITGNISTGGELQLDGAIDGDLVCGSLVMGEEGSVRGTIKSDTVVIRGAVKGEVRARSVRLESSAIIEGDVYHETLAVEAGARLTGQFCYTSASQAAANTAPKAANEETPKETSKPAFAGTTKSKVQFAVGSKPE